MRFILESTIPIPTIPCAFTREAVWLCGETQEWFTIIDLDEVQLAQFLADINDRATIYLRARPTYYPPSIPLVCLHIHNEHPHRTRITIEDTGT